MAALPASRNGPDAEEHTEEPQEAEEDVEEMEEEEAEDLEEEEEGGGEEAEDLEEEEEGGGEEAEAADALWLEATEPVAEAVAEDKRWPGWPGDIVYRLIVPVLKVGGIIGRKGELIKKLCEDTRARVRILDGPLGTSDRVVLISAKEEPEAELSPAMDAVLRVFKRVNGVTESEEGGATTQSLGPVVCSVRLLMASTQAISLIGKQGTCIKSIQENSGASVRVLSGDELPFYVQADERIVEIQGETLKVLKALEAVVRHLRKFLVDHSVLPLFEQSLKTQVAQDRSVDATQSLIQIAQQSGIGNDYPLSLKRDSLFLDRGTSLDSQFQRSGLSLYGQDPSVSRLRSSGLGRTAGSLVTQITQTMQIPLSYAEDIIGIGGANIQYIRKTSGAFLSVQETVGVPDEITVEIKGTSSQVQLAQHLIQEFIRGHKETVGSAYGSHDAGFRSTYPSSSFSAQSFGGYESSGLGGYGSYRY